MHIHAELYERLKCLGQNDWIEICRDLLGVDLINEVTVHEGEIIIVISVLSLLTTLF